jgi:hypothetical protein
MLIPPPEAAPLTFEVVRFVVAQGHPLPLGQTGALSERNKGESVSAVSASSSLSAFGWLRGPHAHHPPKTDPRQRTIKSNATTPTPIGSRCPTASSASRRLPLLQWQYTTTGSFPSRPLSRPCSVETGT